MKMVDQESVLTVYVDIFGCKSEYEFYNRLVEAIIKQTASNVERWMENARDFLARLTPKISINPEPLSEFASSSTLVVHPISLD